LPTTKAPNNWLSISTKGGTLTGTAGKYNQLAANAGGITLVGAANGNNTFIVYDGSDKIVQAASSAVNTVETWGSGWTLQANVQNLTLEGTANAYGIGTSDNNLIIANAGNDVLTTGGGNDVLVAGTGIDTFNLTQQANTVTWIEGFKTSGTKIDKLNLSTYFSTFGAVQSAETQVGADLQINLGSGQTVMLQNTQASALTAASVQTGVDLSSMHMTFDEEFNSIQTSTTSATLTTSQNVWKTTLSGGVRSLSSNGEQEVYVDPSYQGLGLNPFSDTNGVLTIQAAKTPAADLSKVYNLPYTSGIITTQGTFAQQYGYFEAGIETPAGQGLWPAFWLLPANGQWPPELDVMEQVDNTVGGNTTSFSTVHSTVVANASFGAVIPTDLTSGFHTYGMNWTASTITFYVDGQQIFQTATPADDKQPMYMLLNLAVGGTWPGSPDATTDFSTAQMKVDYVHVYSSDPNIPAVGGSTSTGTTTTGTGTTGTGAGSGTTTGSSGTAGSTSTSGTTTPTPGTAPSVMLSNDTTATSVTSNYVAAAGGPGTSTTYTAAQMAITGVTGTTVTVAYDASNNVTVTNNGAWNTIKDATVKSAVAGGVTIANFVDAEVTLGTGASTVNITGIKRGDITTGDGNSAIAVTGASDSPSGNGVNIKTGNGNDNVTFTGGTNDATKITVGNGNNTVTLANHAAATVATGSGSNDIVDNSTGTVGVTLGTGSNVLEFLAGAHATVTNFDASKDSIILHGPTASQIKVTAAGGATNIDLGNGASIHLAGVSLSANPSQIAYA
jgi:beta-glucanase (GH16 family)